MIESIKIPELSQTVTDEKLYELYEWIGLAQNQALRSLGRNATYTDDYLNSYCHPEPVFVGDICIVRVLGLFSRKQLQLFAEQMLRVLEKQTWKNNWFGIYAKSFDDIADRGFNNDSACNVNDCLALYQFSAEHEAVFSIGLSNKP